jgi:hypothetical protein
VSGTVDKTSATERRSDAAGDTAGKMSERERNEGFSKRHGERVVRGRNKRVIQ